MHAHTLTHIALKYMHMYTCHVILKRQAIRTKHGGLRAAASKLWLQRADLGLAEDFVLEPLPYMLTDAASNDAVWLQVCNHACRYGYGHRHGYRLE